MMIELPLAGFAIILVLGVVAQWVAWRLRWPAILLLLVFGFLAGPVSGLIAPDALFGSGMVFTIVSVSVAIILFEGGLKLRIGELRERKVVRRLVVLGSLITASLTAAAAHLLAGLADRPAILLGAILVVTGPTVIMPLLRQLRLSGQTAPVLKWEGQLNDPLGAMLAVLVFEVLFASSSADSAAHAAGMAVLYALLAGVIIGPVGAVLLVLPIRRFWLPDFLQSPVALAIVLGVFAAANSIQHESGLLAVVVMGAALANQRWVDVTHIAVFKENLRVLLVSFLFILLAARIPGGSFTELGLGSALFVGALILIVRPAAVMVSTFRSGLGWRERALLSMVAPRGIVAAAVASTFALQGAAAEDSADMRQLVPLTFLVIVATIVVAGVITPPLSRWLGLAEVHRRGYLIIGAHPWARRLAEVLREKGVRVMLLDDNWNHVRAARMAGLPVHRGHMLSPGIVDEIDMRGIGRLLALTSNDEANFLASVRFAEVFDRADIYQLPPGNASERNGEETGGRRLHGRYLFEPSLTHAEMLRRHHRGYAIKATPITERFDYEAFQARYSAEAIPLFRITSDEDALPFTADDRIVPEAGQTLISFIPERFIEETEKMGKKVEKKAEKVQKVEKAIRKQQENVGGGGAIETKAAGG